LVDGRNHNRIGRWRRGSPGGCRNANTDRGNRNIRIEELPLNGRAVAQLIALVPGSPAPTPPLFTRRVLCPIVQPSSTAQETHKPGICSTALPFWISITTPIFRFLFPTRSRNSAYNQQLQRRYGGNAGAVVKCRHQERNKCAAWKSFRFNRNRTTTPPTPSAGPSILCTGPISAHGRRPRLYSTALQRPRSHLLFLRLPGTGRDKPRSIAVMCPPLPNSREIFPPSPALSPIR